MRILILEDDPAISGLLEDVLKKHGHEPSSFGHAGLALGAIARGRFELMLCDIMLPNLGGFEAMRMARSQFPFLPMIAISADGREEVEQRALEVGASFFMSKPLNVERLLEEVRLVEASQVDLTVAIVDADGAHAERTAQDLTSLGCEVHRFESFEPLRDAAPPAGLSVLLVDAAQALAPEAMAWGAERKLAAIAFGAGGQGAPDEDTLLRRGASFCMPKPVDTQALVTQARFFVSPGASGAKAETPR